MPRFYRCFRAILLLWPIGLAACFFLACAADGTPSPGPEASGTTRFALSHTENGESYRFIGTLRVLDGDGDVVETIDATESSPATESVGLLAGEYTVEIPDGYFCTYQGPLEDQYTGCSFVQALPNPFQVLTGETTEVALQFSFQFHEDEQVVVFEVDGTAEFVLVPQHEVTTACGEAPACEAGEFCASLEGQAAECYAECTSDGDCDPSQHCTLVSDGSMEDPFGLCLTDGGPTCELCEDTTPPVVTDLSFTPTSIDTTTGDATVTVTMSGSDDLSGMAIGGLSFRSPSGGQYQGCSLQPTGSTTDWTASCDIVFPQYGEGGTWVIDSAWAYDVVGNYSFQTATELDAAGLPTELAVTAEQDVSPPVLTDLSFTPTSIDTTTGDATVTVTMSGSDDLSGMAIGGLSFRSPSGDQYRGCSLQPTGSTTDWTASCDIVFPQYGEGGTWVIDSAWAYDVVGNYSFQTATELDAAGLPTLLEVNPD